MGIIRKVKVTSQGQGQPRSNKLKRKANTMPNNDENNNANVPEATEHLNSSTRVIVDGSSVPSVATTAVRKRIKRARRVSDPSATPPTPTHSPPTSAESPTSTTKPYTFIRHIGQGSFGDIYEGIDNANNKPIAIKLEVRKAAKAGQLEKEFHIYEKFLTGVAGFPRVHQLVTTRNHHYFGMTLLEVTLEQLHAQHDRKFDDETVAILAVQLITRLRDFHQLTGHVHGDLKPENMMFEKAPSGSGKNGALQLLDFGLAKKFRHPETGEHLHDREISKGLTGTARYASVRGHEGRDLSRRDDLESAAYVLIYLRLGRLPWQGIRGPNKKERYRMILEKKRATTPDELCADIPREYNYLLRYAKKLGFEDEPDYQLLIKVFDQMATRLSGKDREPLFDWERPIAFSEDEEDNDFV